MGRRRTRSWHFVAKQASIDRWIPAQRLLQLDSVGTLRRGGHTNVKQRQHLLSIIHAARALLANM